MVPAGSRRAARRSDAGDGSPEASTRSVQRACCAGRRGVLRLAGHGSGRRACTSPAWRARGAGRARDDRDHARQSRWRTLRLARRGTEHAGDAKMHQSRLQMHLRGYATRSHRAHLRVATGYGTCALTERRCMESGLWPTAMNYDKTQRRETWQTRVKTYLLALSPMHALPLRTHGRDGCRNLGAAAWSFAGGTSRTRTFAG